MFFPRDLQMNLIAANVHQSTGRGKPAFVHGVTDSLEQRAEDEESQQGGAEKFQCPFECSKKMGDHGRDLITLARGEQYGDSFPARVSIAPRDILAP
jgi:hypothetical protein